MSYRLEVDEMLSQGVKRIAIEQIDDALSYLQPPYDDLDEAVHESRKCFKKIRGLLRLIRKEIGEEVYKEENNCFRDAGRLLSDLRDSAVKIKTLDTLLEEYDDTIDVEAYKTLHETLVIFYHGTRQRVVEEEKALPQTAGMIQAARQRVARWPVKDDSFTAVAGGLRKIYKRGRNRLDDAAENPTAEAFHEWRKRVKYLWYSIRILRPVWPDPMEVLADEIHDLSDFLGDEHDLAELQALIIESQASRDKGPPLITDDTASRVFLSLIENKRKELQAQAFKQGRYIYTETPDDFVNRAQAYWETTQL